MFLKTILDMGRKAMPFLSKRSSRSTPLLISLASVFVASLLWGQTSARDCTSDVPAATVLTVNTPPTSFVFTGTGNWSSAANWSTGTVPTSSDSATIAPGAIVTLTQNRQIRSILISAGATLNHNANFTPFDVLNVFHNLGTVTFGGQFNSIRIGNLGLNDPATRMNPSVIKGNSFTIDVLQCANNVKTEVDLNISSFLILGGNTFDANNKRVILKSTASNTAKFIGSGGTLINAGNFTVERYMDPSLTSGGGAWVWVGAQTQGQTVSLWSANNPYTAATYTTPNVATGSSLHSFDPTFTLAGANGYRKPTSPTQAAPVGVGHRVWFRTNEFFNGPSAGVWKSTGVPKTSSHTFPLSYCAGSNCASGGTATENGWNLIANPFAATINWNNASGWTKTNVHSAIYIYRHKFANTASYNNGVGVNGGSQLIPSGQGFMVWANNANASLSVTEDAIEFIENTAVKRQGSASDVLKLNISSSNADLQDQIALRWDAAATNGFDSNLEANKMTSANGVNLSFLNGTAPMAIMAETLPTATTSYPLALTAPQAGTYTISFEGLASLSNPQWSLYLLDNQTGISTQVTETASYSFSAAQGANNGRFSLVVYPAGVTSLASAVSNKVLLAPNPASNKVTLQVATAISQATTFHITNAVGQVVMTATMPANSTELSLDLSALAKGVYMVQAPGLGVTKLVKE